MGDPSPGFRQAGQPARSVPSTTPCAPQYATGMRCSIRPGRGAYRADLAPVGFNTAPSQRAGGRRSNRYAQPRHGTCGGKGQVPRRGFAPRPSVSLMTLYGPGRFKGPVGSPLIVPILTLESSASRSRPHRIGRFRRRAILRRFVPHPRKMANVRRLVLAKASHTRPNRRGRLAPPTAGSASRVAVSTNASVRPSLSSAKNSPTARSRLRRFGTGGPQGSCQSPPSVRAQNSAPTAGGACYARRWRGTPLASLARQPYGRARRGTGACTATRPSVCLLTQQTRLRASSVTCASMRNF